MNTKDGQLVTKGYLPNYMCAVCKEKSAAAG